ncbi:D-cysteine desulfhydrase family protein [Anoxynatronum sibiricum]|uniref:D-cysteine desulfhydrase family protein n=1 Tax=Anoxynatronum sibiricum TaxID=210623 RepID=A0ABU9VSJ0_9CLOT
MGLPKKLTLAHLPTPIEKLERLSATLGKELYLKRDDFTGMELSGNKVRKLEFALQEALEQGAKVLITCGGLQSNHARATAVAARKLGLDCHLVLRGRPQGPDHGNLLLDQLLGCTFTFMEPEDFNDGHLQVMATLKAAYDEKGTPAYLLPMGASNAIGTFGYAAAYEEIRLQEDTLEAPFDTIVCAVGSGGTHAGLVLGNMLGGSRHRVVGVPIAEDSRLFRPIVTQLTTECLDRVAPGTPLPSEKISFLDGYGGRGYALNTPEEMTFIRRIARDEGVFLDPVYTGKAFRGLVTEIEENTGFFADSQRILFVHTGGLYGLFPKSPEFLF